MVIGLLLKNQMENKKFYVYLIANLINGKFYIGRTTKSIDIRWKEHVRNHKIKKKNVRCYLYESMRKYGIENFQIFLMFEVGSYREMCDLENKYIHEYKTLDCKHGYNLVLGTVGDIQGKLSKSTAKIKAKSMQLYDRRKSNKYTGVYGQKDIDTYNFQIFYKKKQYTKNFKTAKEAAEAYDKCALYLYGENARLNFPKKRKKYLKEDLKKFIKFVQSRRPKVCKYFGVYKERNKYTARVYYKKNEIFLGIFSSEEEAATARDKVHFLLFNDIKKLNFPEKVKEYGIDESRKIYENAISSTKYMRRHKESGYVHVYRAKDKWEVKIVKDKKIYRCGQFTNKEVAARIADIHCRALFGDKAKLNFPKSK